MAGDDAALQRLRTRFGAKMNDSPDAKAFAVVTGRIDQQGVAFQDLAKSIAVRRHAAGLHGRPEEAGRGPAAAAAN